MLLRLIIIVFILYLLYRITKGLFGPRKEINLKRPTGVIDELVKDPFCKTYIPQRESIKRVIGGKEFYFCSDECANKFEQERQARES